MSRALEAHVRDLLRNGNHKEIFNKLADTLGQQHEKLLEIEVLGKSHPIPPETVFLQDDNAIAIPKLRLVQAFLYARELVIPSQKAATQSSQSEVLRATGLMLLFDPEHLTAANTRKRIIQSLEAERHNEVLRNEKYYVDSILTSRLHRHTKSPTLWSHREWLMKQFDDDDNDDDGMTLDDFQRVILVSAERHPRNYYAWSHARYLRHARIQTGSEDARKMLDLTAKWCYNHHDDISGWAFLTILLELEPVYTEAVVQETLKYVQSFHWRGEAVWYFLRNITTHSVFKSHADLHSQILDAKTTLLQTNNIQTDHEWSKIVLDRVDSWIAEHEDP